MKTLRISALIAAPPIACAFALAALTLAGPAGAQELTAVGGANSKQCTVIKRDDAGNSISNCAAGPAGSPATAMYLPTGSTLQLPLPPLAAGSPCSAVGYTSDVSPDGVTPSIMNGIAGTCTDALGASRAIQWAVDAGGVGRPQILQPLLSGALGGGSEATSASGPFIAGKSVPILGASTPVAWRPSASFFPAIFGASPVAALNGQVGCDVAGITYAAERGISGAQTGRILPIFALNCPQADGGNAARTVALSLIEIRSGTGGVDVSLGASTVNLSAAGQADCRLNGISYDPTAAVPRYAYAGGLTAFGSCAKAGGLRQAAIWLRYSIGPGSPNQIGGMVQQVAGNSEVVSSGTSGNALVNYALNGNAGLWNPVTGTTEAILSPTGGGRVSGVALANNDTAAVNLLNDSGGSQAAFWKPGSDATGLGYAGGNASSLTAISPDGHYVGGFAKSPSGETWSAIATLPMNP